MGIRRVVVAALVLLLGGLVPVALAPPARANHVQCGSTLVASTVLDSNLNCPPGVGVTIGADNVTFDLGGHTITGSSNSHPGILLNGRRGVTVKNGTVTRFAAGVAIQGGSGNSVLGLSLLQNVGGPNSLFGEGVLIDRSPGNAVRGNTLQGNGQFAGITLIVSNGNTIDSNRLFDHNLDPGNTAGIRLENAGGTCDSSDFNTITNNLVERTATYGIQLFACSEGNVVRANRAGSARLDGIVLHAGSHHNTVEANVVQRNGRHGVFLQGPAGVFPQGTHDNNVLRNQSFQNNTARSGGFDLRDGHNSCVKNQWHGNQGQTANPPCTLQP